MNKQLRVGVDPRSRTEASPPPEVGPWVMRAVLVAIGLVVVTLGWQYGVTADNGQVGAGFMPLAAGLVMVVAGLVEGVGAWGVRTRREPEVPDGAAGEQLESVTGETVAEVTGEPPTPELDVFGRTEKQRGRAVLVIFGILLGVTLLAQVIGLLLALTLMVIVILLFVERKPWWAALIGGAAAFVFGYVVFGILLDVPLPTGLLGLV